MWDKFQEELPHYIQTSGEHVGVGDFWVGDNIMIVMVIGAS